LKEIASCEEELAKRKEKLADKDDVDDYVREINLRTIVEKIERKRKLVNEIVQEHYQISRVADVAKPSLASLSTATKFANDQIRNVNLFESGLKQRKWETDGGKDLEEEKKKNVKAQMKQLATDLKVQQQRDKMMGITRKKEPLKPTPKLNPSEPSQNVKPDNKAEPKVVAKVDEFDGNKTKLKGSVTMAGVSEAMAKQKRDEEMKKRKAEFGESEDEEEDDKHKKKQRKKHQERNIYFDEDLLREENFFTSWVPPSGQTGDGRTHLNDKLGY
jgi:hypothetical protein